MNGESMIDDHIRDGDDLGFKKDLVSRESVGVPGAVESFVMLEHHFRDRPGELDPLKDLIPLFGMALDNAHFGRENPSNSK